MMVAAMVVFVLVALAPLAAGTLGRVRDPSGRRTGTRDLGTAGVTVAGAGVATLLGLGGTVTGMPAVVIVTATSVAAAVTGGAVMVHLVLRAGGVLSSTQEGADTSTQAGMNDAGPTDEGPLRGGRVIGCLERAAVAGTLLAGWPEGLAIILAVKSLARYPELRAPHASEQFIMGTFASVLWAAAMSGVGHLLMT